MKKLPQWITSSLAGLALALASGLPQGASADIVTNLVSDTTFSDDNLSWEPNGQPRWPWTYNYSWGYALDPKVNPVSDTHWLYPETEPTNVCQRVTFDISAYNPVPSGAGYGVGFGAGLNWSLYDPTVIVWPTNRADYLVSFDARVEGLLPGVTSVTAEMQFQFDSPDDTIQPPDTAPPGESEAADRIIQINKGVSLGTNWAHFEYTLDSGSIGGGSEENLALYSATMNSVNYNVNFHMPSDQFGFDADNVVFLENVKLSVIIKPPPAPPAPKTPFVVSDWNFDDRGAWYNYPYEWTENTNHMVVTPSHNAYGYGVNGSNAWIIQFDSTSFLNSQPSYAGGGSGIGGPFNGANIDTTNLAAYRVTFDARVEGLSANKTSTPGQMQFRFRAPDDSIQPPDTDTDDDTYFSVNYDVTLKSNWQTFAYTFDKGMYSASGFTNFVRLYNQTSSLQPQFQISGAAGDLGADADNVVVVDNLKLERLAEGLPPLNLTLSGSEGTLTWGSWYGVGSAQLQSADSPVGPFTDVLNGTTSPVPVPGTVAPKFYRLKWVPPQ